ncbi:MAG TPA: hypothetical protein ENK15_06855 [Thermopetrobacter sp.]|nr:hypothetical protein [Thermopetrobacter sp.]
MLFKAMSGGALAIAALLIAAEPAAAKLKSCAYTAYEVGTGKLVADGYAKAFKRSRACKRAKRRCNRELKRRRTLRGTRCKFDPNPPPKWKICAYIGYSAGKQKVVAFGRALTMERACKRARRNCKVKLGLAFMGRCVRR